MKRGDYMVHIYIEQAKKLKVEAGDTVDPLVEVACMGSKKFTTAKAGIDNMMETTWGEHIFLDFKNKEEAELEQGKITFRMMDKGMFKDELIGYYEFDMSYIYLQPQHAILHKWVVMSNPNSDNFSEVTAYFKMSIAINGQHD